MGTEDRNYDLLLERFKQLEVDKAELKAERIEMRRTIDRLTTQIELLNQKLSAADTDTVTKRRKASVNSALHNTNIVDAETGPSNANFDNGNIHRPTTVYNNNNTSASVSTQPVASNSAMDTDDHDDNIWRNVLSKKQYQNKKKQQQQYQANVNGMETNTTPIQLGKMSSEACGLIVKQLFTQFKGKGYIFQQIKNGNNPRILTDNDTIKKDIMTFLDNKLYEYNSYNKKSERKKSFVVRGFCVDQDQENIAAISTALESAGLEEFSVSRFITGHQRHNPGVPHNIIYRIVVDNSIPDGSLTNIRTMGYFGVRVERMRASKVVQCHNCQRFNHTSGQCHFNYRCVQCIDPHGPASCPRKANPNFPLGCINCYAASLDYTGHTANNLTCCHYFLKQTPSPAPTSNKNNVHSFRPIVNNSTNVSLGKNFASVVRGANSTASVDPNQLFSMFSQIVEPLTKLCQVFKNIHQ